MRVGPLLLLALACAAGCAGTKPAPVAELRPGLLVGYLPRDALPDSAAFLPPPPAAGSAAFALDEEVARASVALRETPRWTQATLDADLGFPNAAGTFSCAIDAAITEESTPHLYVLLRRTLTDAALATYPAKTRYQRTRPFVVDKAPLCTPADQAMLEKDGSYPSGHASVGWAWALVLTEVAPERTDAIVARGVAYGQSRNVCNVHWHSDVVSGRLVGAAVVARLHADPAFRADLDGGQSELAAVRAQGVAPTRDCAAEVGGTGEVSLA